MSDELKRDIYACFGICFDIDIDVSNDEDQYKIDMIVLHAHLNERLFHKLYTHTLDQLEKCYERFKQSLTF